MFYRQNIANLSADELTTFRQTIGQSMAIKDNRGFIHFAGLHGLPSFLCKHDSPLFLPWHRAYLYMFEMSLRDISPNVSLPWWDWTSDGRWCTSGTEHAMTPDPICYAMTRMRRTESGCPAASIWFSTATPMAASVCCAAKPRARNRGPISIL